MSFTVPASQAEKARRFLELHHADDVLVLLNAWDPASARLCVDVGARAVGTTSMGISAALGYPDIQIIPLQEMLACVERIAVAVDIPVSADMEAGYGDTTEAVVESILAAVRCGVVGINIEDGTGDPADPLISVDVLCERIAAIRATTDALGIHLVINARTDVVLFAIGPEEERLDVALERANAYRRAGADCLFVPGSLTEDQIRTVVEGIDAPVNILANPATASPVVPPIARLAELGVARVSVGSGLMRATLGFVRRAARQVMRDGTYGVMVSELETPEGQRSYDVAVTSASQREER